MGSVKANWFVDDCAAVGGEDPFANGIAVDLTEDQDLLDRLGALMEAEGRLADAGVTCPIRARADCHCSACPHSHHDRRGDALQPLCATTREAEGIVMALAHRSAASKGMV